MKKILSTLAGILLSGTLLYAQDMEEDSLDYKTYAENVIRNLDHSRVPYGILYDKVQPLSNLDYFVAGNDSSCSNTLHFFQAVHEFDKAHLDPDHESTELLLYTRLQEWEAAHEATAHPLGLMITSFGALYPWAVDSGLIGYKDGAYFDINGKNPYRTVNSYVASSLNMQELRPGTHYLYLNADFVITNNNSINDLKTISIHTPGEGWQEWNVEGIDISKWNDLPPIPFKIDSGMQLMSAQVKMQFNLTPGIGSYFHVGPISDDNGNNGPTDCFDAQQNNDGCSDCITLGGMNGGVKMNITGEQYPGTQPYSSYTQNAEGVASIFYANQTNYNQGKIRKPVIFIDGYDPTNTRCTKTIYSKYINNRINLGGTIGNVYLADYIRSLGYDLIILDFKEGGRYIEDNAMVVKKLLETLYTNHQAHLEKDFVLIGPSMGALVAQFALTYMEKTGSPHHVRTWISFDGPHQGANVPKSVTDLTEYLLKGELTSFFATDAIKRLTDKFYTNPAARQMLIHHPVSNTEDPQNTNYARSQLLAHLSENHTSQYPQNCRNVAVVNNTIYTSPNAYISSCEQYGRIQLKRLQFPFFLPGSLVNCDYTLRATTKDARCQNASFYTLWPLANIAGVPLGRTNKYSTTNGGKRGLDAAPGSRFGAIGPDEEKSMTKELLKIMDMFKGSITVTSHNFDIDGIGNTTFIPTISAIDYKLSDDMYAEISSGYNLTRCGGNTAFDKVYGAGANTKHVEVNPDIAQAFIDEITGKYDNCPIICATKLNGAGEAICLNQTATVSLDVPVSGNIVVTWTQSASVQLLSSNSNSANIKIIANDANAYVMATLTPKNASGATCSAPIYLRYDFVAGTGYILSYGRSQPGSCKYKAWINPHVSSNTYEWSLDGVNYSSPSSSPYAPWTNSLVVPNNIGQNIYCKINSPCGIVYKNTTFNPSDANSPCSNFISAELDTTYSSYNTSTFAADVYPNPASDYWTVQIPVYINNHFTFTLYDVNGKTVFVKEKIKLENSNYNIAAKALNGGIYLLKIKDKYGKELSFKLVKN